MDKLSKNVLTYLQTCTDHPSDTYHDFEDGIDKIAEAVSSDSDTVRAAIRYLEENGFVKYAGNGDIPLYFYLDHKGLHSKEFQHLEAKERWLERLYGFLSGIAVTVLAELIFRWLAK